MPITPLDKIIFTMEQIEKLSADLGCPITKDDYKIEDLGCPHLRPKSLSNGESAVYFFVWGDEFLKIGKANAKSNPRFVYSHYELKAPSTLAKSLCADKSLLELHITPETVKDWLLNNTRRINIRISSKIGKAGSELIEAVMHYALRPRYEGSL